MSRNDKPRPSAPTFSFLLPSAEILDRDGKPTGVTLQDQAAAAEARLAAYLAIDPELKNVPKEPAGPAQAALMELVRFLARRAARQWITEGALEDKRVGNKTKAIRKHTETASPQRRPLGDEDTIKQPAQKRVKAVAGRLHHSRMPGDIKEQADTKHH